MRAAPGGVRPIVFALLVVSGASAGSAQLIDCPHERYSVLVDEPQGTEDGSAALDKLHYELSILQDEEGYSDVRFVACRGRRPALDASEFNRERVDVLARNALLEIWTFYDGTGQRWRIYSLVPPAAQRDERYPARAVVREAAELTGKLSLDEVHGLVRLARGLNQRSNQKFDESYRQLCTAREELLNAWVAELPRHAETLLGIVEKTIRELWDRLGSTELSSGRRIADTEICLSDLSP